jgi:hypothetical protein
MARIRANEIVGRFCDTPVNWWRLAQAPYNIGVHPPAETFSGRRLQRAEGAAFHISLGQRPRIRGTPEARALKARFTSGASSIIIRPCLNR